MVAKYQTGSKWISSIDVHPGGDNFIIGTYDKKIHWFDMDMGGEAPYKTMKYQDKAIRHVNFSQKWPLFASASDDGTVNVFYGMVYNDLLQNALVVPLKILNAHKQPSSGSSLGAMQCVWHPNQPWLFTSGADGCIKMWV